MKSPTSSTRRFAAATVLLAGLLLVSCASGAESKLSVTDAWARAAAVMDAGDMSNTMVTETPAASEGSMPMTGDMATPTAESMEMPMNTGSDAVSAAYMTIENTGKAADRLVSVTTDAAGVVEIHTVVMDGDVARMQPLPNGLEIPANGSVALEPGSYHLMLMNLQHSLTAGDTITLNLIFESGKTLTVEAAVRQP